MALSMCEMDEFLLRFPRNNSDPFRAQSCFIVVNGTLSKSEHCDMSEKTCLMENNTWTSAYKNFSPAGQIMKLVRAQPRNVTSEAAAAEMQFSIETPIETMTGTLTEPALS
jgi:hypothetical protein